MRDAFALDPTVTFLNHGSFGACPKAVLERQSELRLQLEAEPVRFFNKEYEPLLDAAKGAVASFVGATASGLAFLPNTTHAVNAVLRSLKLAPGDELLTTSHAYNAVLNAMRFAADTAGAKVVIADVPFPLTTPSDFVAVLLAAVTPKTRLVVLDHVTSPTALVLDLSKLVPELEQRGVMTFVDGAHAPGMLELDIMSLGPSFYAGNLHKWVCGPKGAAFLWVREDRRALVRPLAISHGANATRTDRSRFQLEHDWTGTSDPTAYLSVPTAIEVMSKLAMAGWSGVRATNRAMAIEARSLLLSTLKLEAPAPESMLGSMATIVLPKGKPGVDPLQERLYEEHRIEVPVMHFGGRRLLRISAQRYNTWADYEKLATVLPSLL